MNVINSWKFLQGFFIPGGLEKILIRMSLIIAATIILGLLTDTPMLWLGGPLSFISCFAVVIFMIHQAKKSAARNLRDEVTKYAPPGKFRIIIHLANSELHQFGTDHNTLEEAHRVRERLGWKHPVKIYDETHLIE
jgi:hypothetical protein